METASVKGFRHRRGAVRRVCGIVCIWLSCMVFVSCGKKSAQEELTPMNAGEKYGGVMGKAMQDAKKLDAVLPLQQLVDAYNAQEGKYPKSLRDLVENNYVRELPQAPKGTEFAYDPGTGKVSLTTIPVR